MKYTELDTADHIAIQNLFSLYGYLVDDNRADEWLALYTEDGVFEAPGLARFEGREEVRKVIQMVAEGSKGKWRHQITNVLAEPGDQKGEANVRMNGLVSDWSTDPAGFTFNDYSARLVKVDGKWLIKEIIAKPNKVTV